MSRPTRRGTDDDSTGELVAVSSDPFHTPTDDQSPVLIIDEASDGAEGQGMPKLPAVGAGGLSIFDFAWLFTLPSRTIIDVAYKIADIHRPRGLGDELLEYLLGPTVVLALNRLTTSLILLLLFAALPSFLLDTPALFGPTAVFLVGTAVLSYIVGALRGSRPSDGASSMTQELTPSRLPSKAKGKR